jgi:hypothetical protein
MTGGGGGEGAAAAAAAATIRRSLFVSFRKKPGDFDLHWRLLRYRGKRRIFLGLGLGFLFVCWIDRKGRKKGFLLCNKITDMAVVFV